MSNEVYVIASTMKNIRKLDLQYKHDRNNVCNLKSTTNAERKINLKIFCKNLPIQMLHNILIKIFAIDIFLTGCFNLKVKNKHLKSLFGEPASINYI